MKKRNICIATLACAAVMSMSTTSLCLSTEALGDQTLTSVASTAITSVVSLNSSFTSKKPTFKSSYTSTTNAIRLNWNKVSGASGYRIYRYNSSTKKWVKVKTIKSGSTTTARITGLSAGSKYRFKVKAYKKYNGKTYWSKASSAKYAATKPKQVTMKSSSASTSAIRLNWSKVKCDGYKIYQKVNGKYKLIKTIRNSSTTTYKVTGLSSGTKYTFKVRAYRKDTAGKVVYAKSGIKTKTTKSSSSSSSSSSSNSNSSSSSSNSANSYEISVSNTKVYGTSLASCASVPSSYATSSTITVTGTNIKSCEIYLNDWYTYDAEGNEYSSGSPTTTFKKVSQNKYTLTITYNPTSSNSGYTLNGLDGGNNIFTGKYNSVFLVNIVYNDGSYVQEKKVSNIKFYDYAIVKAYSTLDTWYKNNITSSMTDEEKLVAIYDYISKANNDALKIRLKEGRESTYSWVELILGYTDGYCQAQQYCVAYLSYKCGFTVEDNHSMSNHIYTNVFASDGTEYNIDTATSTFKITYPNGIEEWIYG